MIYSQQAKEVIFVIMIESQALQRISEYVVENRMIEALGSGVKYMVVTANEQVPLPGGPGKDFNPEPPNSGEEEVKGQRLDAIYDDEPLGFEKDPLESNIRILA